MKALPTILFCPADLELRTSINKTISTYPVHIDSTNVDIFTSGFLERSPRKMHVHHRHLDFDFYNENICCYDRPRRGWTADPRRTNPPRSSPRVGSAHAARPRPPFLPRRRAAPPRRDVLAQDLLRSSILFLKQALLNHRSLK